MRFSNVLMGKCAVPSVGDRQVSAGTGHALRTECASSAQRNACAEEIDAGVLRTDVTADDVWRAMGSVWTVDSEEQIRTLLKLLMDGLRHTSG